MNKSDLQYYAHLISSLSLSDQIYFFRFFFRSLDPKTRIRLLRRIELFAFPSERKKSIELWMESVFLKDFTKKPKLVAWAYKVRSGIDIRMLPYLIKTAQRVKERLRQKIKRGTIGRPKNFSKNP